ncbi:hypothetical protein V1281_002645 [Nitrobacteraceae bacterium AZCC 2161]
MTDDNSSNYDALLTMVQMITLSDGVLVSDATPQQVQDDIDIMTGRSEALIKILQCVARDSTNIHAGITEAKERNDRAEPLIVLRSLAEVAIARHLAETFGYDFDALSEEEREEVETQTEEHMSLWKNHPDNLAPLAFGIDLQNLLTEYQRLDDQIEALQ